MKWLWAVFAWGFMPLYLGGRSSSASSSTTNNLDNRVAVQDGLGLSNSSGNVISVTDGGSVAAAFEFSGQTVDRAFDSVEVANATIGTGYQSLIDAATEIFNRGQGLIGQTQAAVADAYGQAQNTKAGTIDNRTLIALAVAGVVGLFLFQRKRG